MNRPYLGPFMETSIHHNPPSVRPAAAPHFAVAAFARHFSRRRAAAKAHPAACWGPWTLNGYGMARSTVASCLETTKNMFFGSLPCQSFLIPC